MDKKDFLDNVQVLENVYKQDLSADELRIWYENLSFMTTERFCYIIAEVYKTCKYMPKLSEIIAIHKSIPYTALKEQKEVKGDCPKCKNTGYVIYTKAVEGHPYQFAAVCDCGRQQRYDGRQCADAKNQSDYYCPTIQEIGLEVKSNKPSREQVISSMIKVKNSGIVSEEIKNIIRQALTKI